MTNDAGYISYQNMVTQVNTGLVQMQKIAQEMNLEETAKQLENSRKKLEARKFAVGILGEFKRGKSTVINSLLEKEIMPADILPTSATMNRVTYDMQPHVKLKMRDGSTMEIGIDDLPNYVTKLDEEKEAQAAKVEEAVVYYPCKFCQNGVDIVDTPGLNDDERMSRITEEIIPKLDVVIMVLVHDSPFSSSEADFVMNKLMTSDLGRILFLVNKIDTLRREQDRVRAVDEIKKRIREKVLESTKRIYGEDSQEYSDTKQKLGNIKVFPFSALDALEGKQAGDAALIEKSGTVAFEKELTHMLTEERGALELQIPLGNLGRGAQEIVKAIEVRTKALQMSGQEFEEKQNEVLGQIEEMRAQKTQEKKRLRNSAAAASQQLTAQVAEYYQTLRAQLIDTLDNTPVSVDVLQTKGGQDAVVAELQKAINKEMENSMSAFSEKLEMQLRNIAGEEAVRIGNFAQNISGRLDELKAGIITGDSWKAGDFIGMGAEYALAITTGGFGLGGIIEGYREAGFKGAALGGAAGFAAQIATMTALLAVSLPALPVVLIGLAAGPIASKFLVKKVFRKDVGEKKLNEIRQAMEKNLHEMMDDMESRGELEQWVQKRVSNVFDELSAALEEECELLLRDTQGTIEAVKEDLVQNEMQRQKLQENYEKNRESIRNIIEKLRPVSEKVSRVLGGGQKEELQGQPAEPQGQDPETEGGKCDGK